MEAVRRPAEVFPPGEFLRDELDERGWTQADFAQIIDRPTTLVNDIVSGKRRLSPEIAQEIGAALGTSADLWMNLESSYQLWKVGETSGLQNVARRASLYELAPIKEMLRRRWIEPSENLEIMEAQLLQFFRIQTIEDEPSLLHAARKATSYHAPLTTHQRAWLYRAYQVGQSLSLEPFQASNLSTTIAALKPLMKSAEDVSQVPRVLGEAGIRLVIIEPLKGKGSKIDGACILEGDNPTIALSLRFHRLDNFWFVLMHELGHLAEGEASADVLGEYTDGDDKPESEKRADTFASEAIVSQQALNEFVAASGSRLNLSAIEAFAAKHRIHPSLVVGQLQHRGVVSYAQFQRVHADIRPNLVQAAATDGWRVFPVASR
jgi:HTH-type transcriptional regulator/antitoxin HigA